MYIPRGCPFKNYTLFDLLEDWINMYSWILDKGQKYSISDFVKQIRSRDDKADIWRYGHKVIGNVVNFYNSQRRETAQCLVYYIFA